MKSLAALLSVTSFLSACAFVPPPSGAAPRPVAATAWAAFEPAATEDPAADPEAPADPSSDDRDEPPPVAAATTPPPAKELGAAALCTKASTCTTRVSMELCGMFDPKCLDAFHKHVDGATGAKCQSKLDRLPKLVEKYGKGRYVLPAECR